MADRKSSESGRRKLSAGSVTGLALALPALLVFGAILSSADPVFARSVSMEWLTSSETIGQRVMILGFVSFVSCGMLMMVSSDLSLAVGKAFSSPWPSVYDMSVGKRMEIQGPPSPSGLKPATKDSVSAFVAFFGCIGALFAVFILFQARYLFGGNDVVLKTENLSYADYARRGFFELVTVTVMALPMLMFWQEVFARRSRYGSQTGSMGGAGNVRVTRTHARLCGLPNEFVCFGIWALHTEILCFDVDRAAHGGDWRICVPGVKVEAVGSSSCGLCVAHGNGFVDECHPARSTHCFGELDKEGTRYCNSS